VAALPEALVGGRVFQLAFVVRDLEQALERYSTILSTGPWRCYSFGASLHRRSEYRGEPTDFTLGLALTDGTPQFELIEPREGASVHRDWLSERGDGVHHLGVVVESVERTIERMQQAGYPLAQYGEGFGADADGVYAYFDTADALGLMIEAVEPPERLSGPDFVWPPGRAG
jgi:catechol 2,3-dioxygenase-like lactoylglutathione lyase family enzyme